MKEYARALELVLILALAAALAYFGHTILSWRDAAKANAATAQHLSTTAVNTSKIATNSADAQANAQRVDVVVHQQAQTFTKQYDDLEKEDARVAAWNDSVVPERLRDLAHASRCARDRLVDAEAGDGRSHAAEDGCIPDSTP